MIARHVVTATIAALTLGATVAATSTPAAAGPWPHHHHWGWGPGIVGGLAAGALLGGVVAASSASYYGSCYIARRPVTNPWGDVVGYRRVRVCD